MIRPFPRSGAVQARTSPQRRSRAALWLFLALRCHHTALVPGLLVLAATLGPARPADAAVNAAIVANQLVVTGDAAPDAITLRLVAGDPTRLEVLEGATVVGSFARDTFASILVNSGAGNDTVLVSDANGVFTDTEATTMDGGAGDDSLTGGGGAETLLGGPDNDTILGLAGVDSLQGGPGNDTLTGGVGSANEPHLGGEGDDPMVWNPGDGNDLKEGGDGQDTVLFNGASVAEIMAATSNGNRVTFTRNLANIFIDIGTTERICRQRAWGDRRHLGGRPGRDRGVHGNRRW